MSKAIVSIGFKIPGSGSDIEHHLLKSRISLLDFDIAVLDLRLSSFYNHFSDTEYKGKRCLSESNSFDLKDHMLHWQREILDSLQAGKTIFIMLNNLEEVFVSTGHKTYSGTGRNRHTTMHVAPVDNYSIIPGGISVTNARGSAIVVADEIISGYWQQFGHVSEYRVLVGKLAAQPLLTTKSGNKLVGAIVQYGASPGSLVLLPYIDFQKESFLDYDEEGDEYWAEDAIRIGSNFVAEIIALDRSLRELAKSTPPPGWLEDQGFELPLEKSIGRELIDVDNKIVALNQKKEDLGIRLAEETRLKKLLYEKGAPLEHTIIAALQVLGFEAKPYRDKSSEFDVVFESTEGRFLGEAEGKDNKPINIEKLRQLAMNVHEDYAQESVTSMAKGVLFGNAFRLKPLEERGNFFTDKCIDAAKKSEYALVRTTDLFRVVQYLLGQEDPAFAKRCRIAILDSVGPVEFPEISITND